MTSHKKTPHVMARQSASRKKTTLKRWSKAIELAGENLAAMDASCPDNFSQCDHVTCQSYAEIADTDIVSIQASISSPWPSYLCPGTAVGPHSAAWIGMICDTAPNGVYIVQVGYTVRIAGDYQYDRFLQVGNYVDYSHMSTGSAPAPVAGGLEIYLSKVGSSWFVVLNVTEGSTLVWTETKAIDIYPAHKFNRADWDVEINDLGNQFFGSATSSPCDFSGCMFVHGYGGDYQDAGFNSSSINWWSNPFNSPGCACKAGFYLPANARISFPVYRPRN